MSTVLVSSHCPRALKEEDIDFARNKIAIQLQRNTQRKAAFRKSQSSSWLVAYVTAK